MSKKLLSLVLSVVVTGISLPQVSAMGTPIAQAVPSAETLSYGPERLQTIDFWPAILPDRGGPDRRAPLIVFVHGGGWKRGDKDNATGRTKIEHFTGEGYAFASIDYRLVPDATVEQQAQDVADALARLLRDADRLGIDRRHVVLMGHSAGAHLVALVGTDPQYLRKAGLSYRDLSGVIPIDGAAYDVAAQMAGGNRFMQPTYQQAFGEDPDRQRALSPTRQAFAPNAPSFLILHVQRVDGISQAKGLEAALREAGTRVKRDEFAGHGLRGHMEINRRLGDPDYPATAVVDHWLAALFRH